jgi:hypothetical protein
MKIEIDPCSPWAHLAEECAASAEHYHERSIELGQQFRKPQQEAAQEFAESDSEAQDF